MCCILYKIVLSVFNICTWIFITFLGAKLVLIVSKILEYLIDQITNIVSLNHSFYPTTVKPQEG